MKQTCGDGNCFGHGTCTSSGDCWCNVSVGNLFLTWDDCETPLYEHAATYEPSIFIWTAVVFLVMSVAHFSRLLIKTERKTYKGINRTIILVAVNLGTMTRAVTLFADHGGFLASSKISFAVRRALWGLPLAILLFANIHMGALFLRICRKAANPFDKMVSPIFMSVGMTCLACTLPISVLLFSVFLERVSLLVLHALTFSVVLVGVSWKVSVLGDRSRQVMIVNRQISRRLSSRTITDLDYSRRPSNKGVAWSQLRLEASSCQPPFLSKQPSSQSVTTEFKEILSLQSFVKRIIYVNALLGFFICLGETFTTNAVRLVPVGLRTFLLLFFEYLCTPFLELACSWVLILPIQSSPSTVIVQPKSPLRDLKGRDSLAVVRTTAVSS